MSRLLAKLASLRITLAGIVLLITIALLTHRSGGSMLNWLSLPLGLLSMNLLAAILTNRTFRLQSALLSFHIGLFIVLLLVSGGLLTGLHGRIELVEGEDFDLHRVEVISAGPLHQNTLRDIHFRQGPIEVQYESGLQRGSTRSRIDWLRRDRQEASFVAGDRQGLSAGSYRFKPTFNKGFAMLLEWHGEDGARGLGAINFPSFPEYEWSQRNSWTTPAGETIAFELRLPERVPQADAWTLRSADRSYTVTIDSGSGTPLILADGDSIDVDGGSLTVSGLRMWIGYRIDSNPFLPWILAAALFSVVSLGAHFHLKYGPVRTSAASISPADGRAA